MASKADILDRIKFLYNIRSNVELANFLGVTPQTISNWYSRNTINFDKVIEACGNSDLNWLLTGKPRNGDKCEKYPLPKKESCPLAADLTATYHASNRGKGKTK